MDLVRKEHERLTKRLKASQNTKNVRDTIDLIQAARDTIASGSFLFVGFAAILSLGGVH
jgi:hypothetical protein